MTKKLKKVPEDNPGLKKLPTEVRNKMGFMKEGGRAGYKDGGGCMQIKGFGKARKPKKKTYA